MGGEEEEEAAANASKYLPPCKQTAMSSSQTVFFICVYEYDVQESASCLQCKYVHA